MKPDGAAWINCDRSIVPASAPADLASVEPRFDNYANRTRREQAPIGFTPIEPGFENSRWVRRYSLQTWHPLA